MEPVLKRAKMSNTHVPDDPFVKKVDGHERSESFKYAARLCGGLDNHAHWKQEWLDAIQRRTVPQQINIYLQKLEVDTIAATMNSLPVDDPARVQWAIETIAERTKIKALQAFIDQYIEALEDPLKVVFRRAPNDTKWKHIQELPKSACEVKCMPEEVSLYRFDPEFEIEIDTEWKKRVVPRPNAGERAYNASIFSWVQFLQYSGKVVDCEEVEVKAFEKIGNTESDLVLASEQLRCIVVFKMLSGHPLDACAQALNYGYRLDYMKRGTFRAIGVVIYPDNVNVELRMSVLDVMAQQTSIEIQYEESSLNQTTPCRLLAAMFKAPI